VASAPNQKWIADFTYIWTAQGWLYVAAVVDLYSRRVVGWSMSSSMAAQLVTDALIMAIWRRGKPDSLLHHSDQGSQYTSEQFQRLIRASELRGLAWADVDFAKARIHVRQRADRYNAIGRPKSEAGDRDVPIPVPLVNVLRKWRWCAPRRIPASGTPMASR